MEVFYTVAVAIVLAFVLAAIVVRLSRALLARFVRGLEMVDAHNRAAVQARVAQLTGALTLLAYGVAALASISLGLSRFGIGEPRWDAAAAGRWLSTHGINVIIIVAGAFVVVRAANLAIDHLQYKLGRHHVQGDLEWERRAVTLGGILTRLVSVFVGFVAVLMLLRELSIDIVPLLTGAGIAGLAIGFGAQNLVRDVISGFFLILEDQVRIGDHARINGVDGTVEQINLRTIVLRDGQGAVQVFPNGTITALANLSKQFAYAIVDFHVAYSENIDRVSGAIREVGSGLERDTALGPLLLSPIEIVGVESLDGGMATLRVRFKVLPLHQGRIANELRRRAMTTMVRLGVKPYAG